MKKRCTNSSCRKVFTVTGFKCICPYCGKHYSGVTLSSSESKKLFDLNTSEDSYLHIRKSTIADRKNPVRTIFIDDFSVIFSEKFFSTVGTDITSFKNIVIGELTRYHIDASSAKSIFVDLYLHIRTNRNIFLNYSSSSISSDGTIRVCRNLNGSTMHVSKWLSTSLSSRFTH